MVTVFFDTPFLGHMLTQQTVLSCGDRAEWCIWFFDKFFLVRYKLGMVFRFSPVCSKLKFKFFTGIQLLAQKPFRKENLTLKIDFWGQVYYVKWFSAKRVEYQWRTLTCICCKPGWTWKPGQACNWSWPRQEKSNIFFSKKSNAPLCLITKWKDSLLRQHLSKKRRVKKRQ